MLRVPAAVITTSLPDSTIVTVNPDGATDGLDVGVGVTVLVGVGLKLEVGVTVGVTDAVGVGVLVAVGVGVGVTPPLISTLI